MFLHQKFSQKPTSFQSLAGTFCQLIGNRLLKASTTLFNSFSPIWISIHSFQTSIKLLQNAMSRGFRKEYIQRSQQNCENLYQEYNFNHDGITANRLLKDLNKQRKKN
jgi:hypothetical protein